MSRKASSASASSGKSAMMCGRDACAATVAARAVSSWLRSGKRTVNTGVVACFGSDNVSSVESIPPDCSTPIGTSLISWSSTTRGNSAATASTASDASIGPGRRDGRQNVVV